ncbi:biotin/lipoyl-containing protein [Pseudonocardia sp. ICBG1142]|uniref:acetyl-CoA carboxylase biotin carboxyl carrier protein n=1 Tax=Pseudonocardia sp. ICBG1142 TaxID=2846760 RepID=UPI001CF624F3|nr:biotin/lipoyl-containing protein [Pseudonocardia sp. ICBG1142]
MSTSDLGAVLDTLHRAAVTMAAAPRPPERIRLAAGEVTLEWDLAPAGTASAVPAPAAAAPAPGPAAGTAAAEPAAGDTGAGHTLTAPTVGVFYRSPEPGAPPFVGPGDLVSPGQQVGIVEAMKLMIPVEADRGGRVVEVLCPDAAAVEFGAPLFALAEG